jgi:N-acetylglucosaminyldiphosphoundecaprenol N-acetyl-beta-D-mannosaminyltransferase
MLQDLDRFPSASWYFQRKVHCLLGLPIDIIHSEELIDIVRRVNEHRGRLVLVTPSTDEIVLSLSDEMFRNAFLTSDVSIPDGMPVVWLGRFLGLPIRERLAGADLFDSLQQGRAGQMTAFFYGGDSGVASLACQMVNQSHGALHCVGWVSPGFGSFEDLSKPEYIDEVNRASPDLLILSLGKQGRPWIVKNASRIDRGIISHLGAVINFAAGRVRRAPKAFQRMGLEWLWRILQEPALFQRYFRDALILTRLIAQRVLPLKLEQVRYRFFPPKDAKTDLRVSYRSDDIIFQLCGAWTESSLSSFRRALLTASEREAAMTFDLSLLSYMDSAVVGAIVLAYGWQLRSKRRFRISAHSKIAARILDLHCCGHLLESA